jgi:hypothetical protein
MAVDIDTEHGDAKKLAWHLRLVANEGLVASAVNQGRQPPEAGP